MHLARSVLFLCSVAATAVAALNGSFLCPEDQHVAWCSVYSWQIQGYAALKPNNNKSSSVLKQRSLIVNSRHLKECVVQQALIPLENQSLKSSSFNKNARLI
ncbi:uncharacterized protein PGTG_05111 [Puccinia graminis f. sp. tritici CRL 75-36-700-3]|uniref:Uncharacterized protein n=1 Tax=Puccinia graminis f. sp. tritici (strain CRL 75-36-700-3 / race SCCL) TaxID=418459 RepID=E3K6G4_PUCGT|nr:uncharacterized protein PGTG_05111 [Puccinia graminis f. sp. tritici CRL 75-36-700-3]EFP79886.2 hypothetical protein PGTG_05111 [Puccinia graminis f. sp. tritici CRL 75-36-700-3]